MMGSIVKLTRWSLQSEVHIYFFDTGSETFFGTKFFETGSGTFFGTKFFWDRFRDFFRYQIFSRPVPRLFSVPNFFETGSDTIKKIEEFPGTGIPGTGTSHSGPRVSKCWKWVKILKRFDNGTFVGMKLPITVPTFPKDVGIGFYI